MNNIIKRAIHQTTAVFLRTTTCDVNTQKALVNGVTSFAVVRYGLEVDEVRADDCVHRIVVPQLNFYPLAQGREHFGENNLLVPHWRIAVFPHARFALKPTDFVTFTINKYLYA